MPLATIERVLGLVQSFDPSGVGARDLAECLAIQLREHTTASTRRWAALVSRLDLVAKRDFASLRRLCGVDDDDIADMLAELRGSTPSPAGPSAAAPVEVLVPDVFVRPARTGRAGRTQQR